MRRGRPRFLAVALVALLALTVLWAGSGGTLSGFAAGSITNGTDSAVSGSVAFTHTYSSSCSAGPRVSSVACGGVLASGLVPSSPAVTSFPDTITNNGNLAQSQLSQSVAAASCEPAQFANSALASNPLLPRYGTTFNTSGGPLGGIANPTLDGANPGGYAAAVSAESIPAPSLSLGASYGWGVWFKTSSTAGGPLMGFDSNADNSAPTNADHIIYLDGSGHLGFGYAGNSNIVTTGSTNVYNNGAWHFAYARVVVTSLLILGTASVTLYVDGSNVASTSGISLSGTGGLQSFTGYWHLGWAPLTSKTYGSGLSNYFAGSLSNAIVLNTASAPAPPATNPSTQSAFNTAFSSPTDQWVLTDTGTSTYTGTLPVVGAGSGTTASGACKSLDLGWTFVSPAGTATSASTSLFTLVTTGATSVSAPGAGATQTATLALAHDAAYNSYVAGLHLVVPMSSTVSVLPGNAWVLTFSWTPGNSTTIEPAP